MHIYEVSFVIKNIGVLETRNIHTLKTFLQEEAVPQLQDTHIHIYFLHAAEYFLRS
jgi:hypothetical protein